MPIYNPDDNEKDDPLQELNLVLIEFSVFTNSMSERRKLLVPLLEAGVTPEQLRTACQHQERTSRDKACGPANIINMVRDDPKLTATLYAAQKWLERRDKPAPGERDRRENMEREALNPDGERQRRAMYAYCAITHKEVASTAELATRLKVSVTEAEELVEHGRRVYAGEEPS